LKDPVREKPARFGLMRRFGEGAFFATIEEAVDAFLVASRAPGAGRPRPSGTVTGPP
jgi:hypothetical protein